MRTQNSSQSKALLEAEVDRVTGHRTSAGTPLSGGRPSVPFSALPPPTSRVAIVEAIAWDTLARATLDEAPYKARLHRAAGVQHFHIPASTRHESTAFGRVEGRGLRGPITALDIFPGAPPLSPLETAVIVGRGHKTYCDYLSSRALWR